MIDTHVHYSHPKFLPGFPYICMENGEFEIKRDGRISVLFDEMKKAGIDCAIEPAISIESNEALLSLCEQSDGFLYPAVGVHPTRTFEYLLMKDGQYTTERLSFSGMKKLRKLTENPAVVAIGETGLDYSRERKTQHRLRQLIWFIFQLRLADKKKLPVILHIREADKHGVLVLKIFKRWLHGGVAHCFYGDYALAEAYASLGLKLGIGAALLGRNEEMSEAVRKAPLDWLVLETDSPYVKPPCDKYTKKQRVKARNTSLILPAVAEEIARLKGITAEEVIEKTTQNAKQVFGI